MTRIAVGGDALEDPRREQSRDRAPNRESAEAPEACQRSPLPRPVRSQATTWSLLAGLGVLGTEGAAGYLRPALGITLAAAEVAGVLFIALILLTAILRGSDKTCERAFRILRCATNRAEPPAPPRGDHG